MLVRNGYRGWKLHSRRLVGKPDFVFLGSRLVIFIDGCFWHGCPTCGHITKTNSEYWNAKIARTKNRDGKYSRELRKQGYRVIRIWECMLKNDPDKCLKRIAKELAEHDYKMSHPENDRIRRRLKGGGLLKALEAEKRSERGL